MESRTKTILSTTIPRLDYQDTLPLLNATKRQTAPEYSQNCYETLLRQEVVIGNYFDRAVNKNKSPLFSIKERKRMIVLIETLQQMKNYKDDTFFLAVSIVDRYLAYLTDQDDVKPPCRVILAVTCLLIAAKIEQHSEPSITLMIKLLQNQTGVEHVTKKSLVDCEYEILMALQFDIRHVSPRQFLDRFQHLMNLDGQNNELHEQICTLSHQFCLTILKDKASLEL